MKLLIYADPHFCTYSSILRGRGKKYSVRLENLIKSLNWVQKTAEENNCDSVICLGDFFDKSELNPEEVTALGEVDWASIPQAFIVGNHEMGRSTLDFSSAHLFKVCPNATVFDSPQQFISGDTQICFLPYVLETDRKPLSEYFHLGDGVNCPKFSKRIILSHNDIAGVQMGQFISKDGFSTQEISENCDLFINGHLHNGTEITRKIINLGNLTGQNFSEDGFVYKHRVMLIDTDTLQYMYIENPYAFYFYKIDCTDLSHKQIEEKFSKVRPNSVLTVSCYSSDIDFIKPFVEASTVIESKVIIRQKVSKAEEGQESTEQEVQLNTIDHLERFRQYILEVFGTNDVIKEELEEVCK